MKLLLACCPDGGIGYQNRLPWDKLDGDLARFKSLTTGGILLDDNIIVVMGRNTWESLPKKPLPGRLNFVVTSKNLDLPSGAIAVKDLTPFMYLPNAWLIGGAQLVNSSWDYIDEIHLSRAFTQYDCDSFVDLIYLQSRYHLVDKTVYSDHDYEVWKKNESVSSVT